MIAAARTTDPRALNTAVITTELSPTHACRIDPVDAGGRGNTDRGGDGRADEGRHNPDQERQPDLDATSRIPPIDTGVPPGHAATRPAQGALIVP